MMKKKVGTMIVVMLFGTALLSACGKQKIPLILTLDPAANNTMTFQLPNNGPTLTAKLYGSVYMTVNIDTNNLISTTGVAATVVVERIDFRSDPLSQGPATGKICISTHNPSGGIAYLRPVIQKDLQFQFLTSLQITSDIWAFGQDLMFKGTTTGLDLHGLLNLYLNGTGFKAHQTSWGVLPSDLPLIGGSMLTMDITLISTKGGTQTDCDLDEDGITDRTENKLLQRFSPFYLFSKNAVYDLVDGKITLTGFEPEAFAPMDPQFYAMAADLKEWNDGWPYNGGPPLIDCVSNNDQGNILTCIADDPSLGRVSYYNSLIANPVKQGKICLQPSQALIQGWPWDMILEYKNIGLIGHVVRANVDYQRGVPQTNTKPWLYKIEYWQFFPYNRGDHLLNIGDHQGDWCTVQLLYDPERDQIVSVFHYAHGGEMRFDFGYPDEQQIDNFAYWGPFREYQGFNYPATVNKISDSPWVAQNNLVRFYLDRVTGEYSHPVVYIEHGGHEFWPSEYSAECMDLGCAPPHAGDDYDVRYLTTKVENVGEVEHSLLPSDNAVMLQFNGFWGCGGTFASSPPGPGLHTEWTYPADSKVRPHLGGQLEN